jgi:hypothetical protein
VEVVLRVLWPLAHFVSWWHASTMRSLLLPGIVAARFVNVISSRRSVHVSRRTSRPAARSVRSTYSSCLLQPGLPGVRTPKSTIAFRCANASSPKPVGANTGASFSTFFLSTSGPCVV